MFNNVILDLFIGLLFIFLLYSLLASIVQEFIAHRMNLRARMLQKAIRKMLEDQASVTGTPWQRSTFYNYFGEIWENIRRFFRPFREHEKLIKKFYDHPSVKYLGEDKSYSKPAYLQPHNFSNTLIQLLREKKYDGSKNNEAELIKNALDNNTLQINQETLSHLRDLFADARQDAFQFRQRLEQWYDETMQRTSGWYKRQNSMILVLIGFAIAWVFNVDTIAIAKILSKDKKAREQLVEMAISRKDSYGAIIDSIEVRKSVDTAVLTPNAKDSTVIDTTYIKGREAVVQEKATAYGDRYFDSTYNQLKQDAGLAQTILGLSIVVPDSIEKAHIKSLDSINYIIDSLDKKIDSAKTDAEKKELKAKKKEQKTARCKLNEEYKDIYLTHPYQKKGWLKVLGWLLTAWAISLGAPFWFDLLNRFIQLRSNGPRVPTGSEAQGSTGKTSSGKTIRG